MLEHVLATACYALSIVYYAVALGRHNITVWETALRRLVEFRDAGNDDRFFDIGFEEMQTDPIATAMRASCSSRGCSGAGR